PMGSSLLSLAGAVAGRAGQGIVHEPAIAPADEALQEPREDMRGVAAPAGMTVSGVGELPGGEPGEDSSAHPGVSGPMLSGGQAAVARPVRESGDPLRGYPMSVHGTELVHDETFFAEPFRLQSASAAIGDPTSVGRQSQASLQTNLSET